MPLNFNPPLLNSSNPWATTIEDLSVLYDCADTGAVTIRTSLLNGFNHDDTIHQYTFWNPQTNEPEDMNMSSASSSLNTLGYSPIALQTYLQIIDTIISERDHATPKPIIISVTGEAQEIEECYRRITLFASTRPIPILMEINLSCPNITGKPPPAFSNPALMEYLSALQRGGPDIPEPRIVPIGIKVPPYTYSGQFEDLIRVLLATTENGGRCPVDFITATNTLGNCLVLASTGMEVNGILTSGQKAYGPAVPSATGTGIGGLGGSAIHALSLGNVYTIRKLLNQYDALRQIEIIGVGGVSDKDGFERMRSVGAAAVAVGTALGKEGIGVFNKIAKGTA